MGEHLLLAFTAKDHWEAGIGDPTFMGWFTFFAYLVAAALSLGAARISRRDGFLSERRFWSALTVCLVLLAINKQLDLQTWFTLTGKHLAQQTGWYAQRQTVQAAFVLVMAASALVLLLLISRLARKTVRQYRVALAGVIFLGCFIVIRAASFHHIDQMLGWQFGYLRMNHLLECGGIVLVALAAANTWRAGKHHERLPEDHFALKRS